MVLVAMRAPNVTNILSLKMAPTAVCIDLWIPLNHYIHIAGKTVSDWIQQYIKIPVYFQTCDVYFINQWLAVPGIIIVFP